MDHPATAKGRLLAATIATILAAAGLAPAAAAQESPTPAEDSAPADGTTAEEVDIETIGEVVVVGRKDRNLQQATTDVISVLTAEDIARTGDGDIAGALGRVTGLSVGTNGFVYVRGLGDRYSQAFLNGSPLPSPEPLRRAVPLDLFPTDIIASSLVQKSYSANLAGEFGGGLINLTTLAVPREPFLKIGVSAGGDAETTGQVGYSYYGSKYDATGRDNGSRDYPAALSSFIASGERLSSGVADSGDLAKEFFPARNVLMQELNRTPGNLSVNATGGTSRLVGDGELGFIGTAGYSNAWRTRDLTEQTPASFDLATLDKDYHRVTTENRIVVTGLAGLGYEWGEGNRVRWTNLLVRDTIKRGSVAEGKQNSQSPTFDFLEQETGWYERQLWSTQLNGGFEFAGFKLGARASYAESAREAPFETAIGYSRSNLAASPYGAYYLNRLDNGQTGYARIAFSDLDESLVSFGADLTREVTDSVVVSAGYEYTRTNRDSRRREFLVLAPSNMPTGVGLLRADYLLGPGVIDAFNLSVTESTESDPAFSALLKTDAFYGQVQAELVEGLEVNLGARFERGEQRVSPLQVFNTPSGSNATTALDNDYVLPALTLTYKFLDDMQVRMNVSKTIARPQFRELMFQAYFDPESNRSYRGNPLLVDSEFKNAELRYEWYFAEAQRFAAAGFYKKIDRPIEAFTGFNDNTPVTSFANAPEATLYGIELETEKRFDLDQWSDRAFFSDRRLVAIANYTWSQSEISVKDGDTTEVFGTTIQPASNFFVDGSPLTGQSDHLVNLQLSLESASTLSQQTLLLTYNSDRVYSRGAAGLPDVVESPGVNLDFVVRQGVAWFGMDLELKFEARNLLSTEYKEFQQRGPNRVYFNRYDAGIRFSASVTASF